METQTKFKRIGKKIQKNHGNENSEKSIWYCKKQIVFLHLHEKRETKVVLRLYGFSATSARPFQRERKENL